MRFIFFYRYKRLMFGICSAPELFQKVMETIVAGLEGVVVFLDDVMVYGRSSEEHDRRLNALLDRLESYGVLLNHQKCQYNVTSLQFLGYDLSADGVKPTESRVQAIQEFRAPLSASELRSFLGLVTYVGRFVPHLASKTDPLRSLLRKGVPFKWEEIHQKAFESIKQEILSTGFLGFFNPADTTLLIADASPTGLGAVLLQENRSNEKRIIAFASKALTDLERKYFQTEREALALVWAVERFKLFLLGTKFKLITDCKPLDFLFSHRSKPCPRIERWVLRVQSFSFEVVYQPGATNLADSLSRLPVVQPKPFDQDTELYIMKVTTSAIPEALTIQEIEEHTNRDEMIQKVMIALDNGVWPDEIKMFKPFQTELYRSGGLLMRGERIVIPADLQQQTLRIAHESHPGIVSMKRRLRQKVWWPAVDKQAEKVVKSCKSCTIVSALDPPEPIKNTRMPDRAWADLAADFVGPLPSGHNLLVIVDYFSRFVEVVVMKQITATLTVQAFHETFCRFGFPETLKTDNGPQFTGEEMKTFCKQFGIEHRKTTPYWPQANGEVERVNGMIEKHLKISHLEETEWKWDLRMSVLMYNSTPHSSTGVAPSVLLFGRLIRDKLPAVSTGPNRLIEEAMDRDKVSKRKSADYTDSRRRAKQRELKAGDIVFVKRMIKDNKLASTFSPEEWKIVHRCGSDVTLQSMVSDKIIHRNVAHLKLRTSSRSDSQEETSDEEEVSTEDIWSSRGGATTQETDGHEQQPGEESSVRPRRMIKKPGYLEDYKINNCQ